MKHSLKIFASVLLSVLLSTSAHAQKTPEALAEIWVDALHNHDPSKLKPYIHPDCPADSIPYGVLNRMVSGKLSPTYQINTTDLGPADIVKESFYVIPEMQLVIYQNTKTPEDRKLYGIGKGFPIAKKNDYWYFVLCMKHNAQPRIKN